MKFGLTDRRRIYIGIWLAVAVVLIWLNLGTLQDQFVADRNLEHLTSEEQVATLAALDRLGISTTVAAGYWLVTNVTRFVVYISLGWLLVRRGQPTGFATWLAVIMLCTTAMVYPPEIPNFFPDQPAQTIVRMTTMLGVSGFFILPLVFPNGQFIPRWTVALGAFAVVEMLLFTWTGKGTPVGPIWMEVIASILFFGTIGGSAYYRYRRISNPPQRQQSRWVLLGFLIGIPSFLLGDAMMRSIDNSPMGAFFLVGFSIFIQIGFSAPFIAVALAVLYHRLFDIDVVLGRTLVWVAMSALVVGTYITVVLGLGGLFNTRDNLVLSIVATGLVAVVFQPVRERVQRRVNRFVFGDRNDPYAVISRLGQQLADSTGLVDLLPQLVHLTAESLRLPYVALYLERAGNLELAAAVGSPTDSSQRFPLGWRGQPVGMLDVAPRGRGEPFNTADRRLLEDLASQIGLAAHAVMLARDLQTSRERIVTSREEERRRLRRDLHDGLGAQLAALTMQAGIVRSLIRQDPDRAEEELDLLRNELRVGLADIRDLVQGLRPPALDELGLSGALRARIERVGRGSPEHPLAVTIDVSEPLPLLSAAAEVAIYRIVDEAITNVVRHARASQVWVAIGEVDGVFTVTVQDDGVGISEAAVSGVGTQSMRERMAELGGTVEIRGGDDGRGTMVGARLPLEASP